MDMEAVKGVYMVPDGSQLNGLNWNRFYISIGTNYFHCYQMPTTYRVFIKQNLRKRKGKN